MKEEKKDVLKDDMDFYVSPLHRMYAENVPNIENVME